MDDILYRYAVDSDNYNYTLTKYTITDKTDDCYVYKHNGNSCSVDFNKLNKILIYGDDIYFWTTTITENHSEWINAMRTYTNDITTTMIKLDTLLQLQKIKMIDETIKG